MGVMCARPIGAGFILQTGKPLGDTPLLDEVSPIKLTAASAISGHGANGA
jgi:hypothetical protein